MLAYWAVTAQLAGFQAMHDMMPFANVGIFLATQQSRIHYGDLTRKASGTCEREISTWCKVR